MWRSFSPWDILALPLQILQEAANLANKFGEGAGEFIALLLKVLKYGGVVVIIIVLFFAAKWAYGLIKG